MVKRKFPPVKFDLLEDMTLQNTHTENTVIRSNLNIEIKQYASQ